MGMFDAITAPVASLASAALGFLGTKSTNEDNADIARSNNAWSAQQYATRYQTMTKDIQAAGLNPMLAYSQNPGTAPSAQQVTFQNPVASATEAYHKASERDVMAAQIQNIQADSRLKDEQAKLIASQKLAADADERFKTASANEATVRMVSQQNYGNPAQQALAQSYWSQIQVNKANLPKIASEIAANGAYAAQAKAQARKAIAEGRITEADLTRALNDERYERSTGGVIRQTTRDIGAIAGARNQAAQADRAKMPARRR